MTRIDEACFIDTIRTHQKLRTAAVVKLVDKLVDYSVSR